MPKKKDGAKAPPREETGIRLGRATVPPELSDRARRKEWGLPEAENKPGDYMVELNLLHKAGLQEADRKFHTLYGEVVTDPGRPPRRVGKTYYACKMSVEEWREIVRRDEEADLTERAIYRIWPDFRVKALIDRSLATVKADAAFRAFAASGAAITWAVIDSGVDASHPHFGPAVDGDPKVAKRHLLLHPDIASLHRDFIDVDDPDEFPDLSKERREQLLADHQKAALSDPFGHGTHVAGIIAGGIAKEEQAGVDLRVFERRFETSLEGEKVAETVEERSGVEIELLRGVAPRCKLLSLRVLDDEGRGRTSDIIRALNYIRDQVNGNPKLLRVQGVNLSVGYEFDAEMFACGQSPLCVEVDRLVQAGVVVVTAAGNTGYGLLNALSAKRTTRVGLLNTINDPGNAALAITVGATHRDAPYTFGVSYFSSKGPTGDGRLKPDLVAPGERITSCVAKKKLDEIQQKGQDIAPLPVAPGNGGAPAAAKRLAAYLDESGTSMAAPHVSGAIAAFLSIRREFIGKPLEVKRIFLASASSLGRERYFEGHGLVDLMRAIQSV